MTEQEALAPCPFCGGECRIVATPTLDHQFGKCQNATCGIEGPWIALTEELRSHPANGRSDWSKAAMAAWNTRTIQPDLDALRAELAETKAKLATAEAIMGRVRAFVAMNEDKAALDAIKERPDA